MGTHKKLPVALILLIIVTAVYIHVRNDVKLIDSGRDDLKQPNFAGQKSLPQPGQSSRPLVESEVIDQSASFNSPKEIGIKSEPVNIDKAQKTTLNLKLWGTFTGNQVNAYAIIEESDLRKHKLLREGDLVQGATIVRIFRERVVLAVDERYEILEIETAGVDVNAKNQYGVTALIDASFKGHKEVVELLIVEEADLNARDNKGDTALMNAAIKGHREIVELLLTKGADVHVQDNSGNTALIDSAKYSRPSTCDVIGLLILYGADVDAQNNYGTTALMNAAQWGHIDNVACLVAEGADIDAKSNSGETALKLAELSDHADIVELLQKQGAAD